MCPLRRAAERVAPFHVGNLGPRIPTNHLVYVPAAESGQPEDRTYGSDERGARLCEAAVWCAGHCQRSCSLVEAYVAARQLGKLAAPGLSMGVDGGAVSLPVAARGHRCARLRLVHARALDWHPEKRPSHVDTLPHVSAILVVR